MRPDPTPLDGIAPEPPLVLALTTSRGNPLLVLHDGHALRCWPSGVRTGTRMHGASERMNWAVEIDGTVEHPGPSFSPDTALGEVAAGVRRWWDAAQPSPPPARVAAPGGGS